MLFYFIIFAIALIGFILCPQNTEGSKKAFTAYWFALMFVVGLGDMLGGYDRYIYGALFDNVADIRHAGGDWKYSSLYFLYSSEKGYAYFNYFMTFLTSNRYIFILTITIGIYVLLYRQIIKFSENYFLSTILFLGILFFFTFTYLRQVLGAAIVWQGIQAVIDRKLLRFLLIVFIGVLFHNSAIIFLPIYFFPLKKMKPLTIILLSILALGVGLSSFASNLFESYGEVSTMDARAAHFVEVSNTFRPEYLLEAGLFLAMMLVFYRQIPSTKQSVVMFNMALIFCWILLVFIQSLNGGRLAWYYMLGLICTMTSICQRYIYMRRYWPSVLMILLSLALYTRILVVSRLHYPYKTFLTPGYVHDAHHIHDNFEYDFDYDTDKFHR